MISLCQVYLGADGNSEGNDEYTSGGENAWRKKFRVLEVVIHYKYNMMRRRGGITHQRTDYDIALIRIDYPAVDEGNGNNRLYQSEQKSKGQTASEFYYLS